MDNNMCSTQVMVVQMEINNIHMGMNMEKKTLK